MGGTQGSLARALPPGYAPLMASTTTRSGAGNAARTTRRLVFVMTTVVVCACGVRSNLKPGPSARADEQSTIIVLGVKAGHAIRVHTGDLEGSVWNYNLLPDPAARSWPDDDGYLVWKLAPLPPGVAYGVTQITVDDIGSPPQAFEPCNGSTAVTFEAPAGKVVYVGDVEFERSPDRRWLGFRLVSDEEGARAYLRKRYPALASELVAGSSAVRKVRGMLCLPNVPMIISIPVG
jgi:hypothetical protein